jgi:hypothetical protein
MAPVVAHEKASRGGHYILRGHPVAIPRQLTKGTNAFYTPLSLRDTPAADAMTAAEDAAQLLSLLAPLLVVVLVAAVIASARADGAEARVLVDEQAGQWARYVFGSLEVAEFATPSSLAAAADGEHG